MSLLSSILLPKLEDELIKLSPDIQKFILKQLKALGADVIEWAETKINVDLNGDGVIGSENNE